MTGSDKFDNYVEGVLDGSIVSGELVRLAVERHVRDISREKEDPNFLYVFDRSRVDQFNEFAQSMKHQKGHLRGKELYLEPWQAFIGGSIFGWRHRDDESLRRFRVATIEVARKNGKTFLAATMAGYAFFVDTCGEGSQEVYCIATTRDQARIAFDSIRGVLFSNKALRSYLDYYKQNHTILRRDDEGLIRPLSRDASVLDGANASLIIGDECHAWPSLDLLEVMQSGMGARRSPLTIQITTAGFILDGPYYTTIRKRAVDTLRQTLDPLPENVFAILYELDKGDNWEDPEVWGKANPNLGISLTREYLADRIQEVRDSPSKYALILTKALNMFVDQKATDWIGSIWKKCDGEVDLEKLAGRGCYGGLDLSTTTDLSAFVLAFTPENGEERIPLISKFWMPEESLAAQERKAKVPFTQWAREGYITATPGDVIDYSWIEHEIKSLAARFRIKEIAFDPWNSTSVVTNLSSDGLEFVNFRQGFATMSPASKSFETLVAGGKLNHGNNPVLRWMAGSVTVASDPAGNIKPVKPDRLKHHARIDGIIASIMAVDRLTHRGVGESVYEKRGLRTL